MLAPFKPTQVLACTLLSVLFLWSGIAEKLLAWSATLAYLQGRNWPLASLLLTGALWIETVGPVLLFFRRTSGAAALVLAIYCASTALLFHPFWAGDDAAQTELIAFLKDFALCGAFLYVFSDVRQRGRHRQSGRAARSAPAG